MANSLIGIDVSAAQGNIDWNKVAQSNLINYVFCKASEGLNFTDQQFKTNWPAIKAHGLVRGAYHFARLSADATAQAEYFVSTLGQLDLTDMLVLDIETGSISGEEFTNWTLTWLERVEALTGCISIVYTGGPFFNSHGGKPDADTITKLSKYPLWLAAYVNNPSAYVPVEWSHLSWSFWQRSGDIAASGDTILHVPGIYGNVDRDVFNGTLDDLKQFALNLHSGVNNNFTAASNTITNG
jgi:lysozyme